MLRDTSTARSNNGLLRCMLHQLRSRGWPTSSVHRTTRLSSAPSSIKIAYNTNAIAPSLEDEAPNGRAEGLEAHGTVGLLKLHSGSYLISITRRSEVAQIRGKPVYAITDVALIPLSSHQDAEQAILTARNALKNKENNVLDSEYEEDGDIATLEDEDEANWSPETHPYQTEAAVNTDSNNSQKGSSSVQDVIKDKDKYSRFARGWFSRGGWAHSWQRDAGVPSKGDLAMEQRKYAQDALPDEEQESPNQETDANQPKLAEDKTEKGPQVKEQSVIDRLTPRILRNTKLFFSSSSFFFSYDFDLSKSLARQEPPSSNVPLSKRFDPLYFWNRHLIAPLIDAGQHGFVLPLIQGFVGQRAFTLSYAADFENDTVTEADDEKSDIAAALQKASEVIKRENAPTHEFFLTLISRRSAMRVGLRYLRRGIDDEGNVANSVETEQILSAQSEDIKKPIYSLVQTRGSIPVFFSQSPYSFKPLPTQFGSQATNQAAFKKHFASLIARYGDVQVASLVDKHATEVHIGQAFEDYAKTVNEAGGTRGKTIAFEWFDFHGACNGMKFENVSILLENIRPSLESFGWTVQKNDKIEREQIGIVRTNCMDCLDRTNVSQSAIAGDALQHQFAEVGLTIDLKIDPKTSWFNTLWADNGDAISKQYAGTAALKGDFTRTRKRNLTGAVSDFGLTLNRYYNNIFGDYFLQICIDYYLGNAGLVAFEEFETDMMSQDYELDMHRIRQNAIDTCIKIVLEDPKDEFTAGWTLNCPREANTLHTLPFEECVLLVTDAALYFCRFDWNTEKVGSFERVALLNVTEIWRGAYITSILGQANVDESKNVGFAMRFKTGGNGLVGTNTRSFQNEKAAEDEEGVVNKVSGGRAENETRLLAFKTLPPKSSAAKDQEGDAKAMSEQELMMQICEEVRRHALAAVKKDHGTAASEGGEELTFKVREHDVISVAEAKKSTGYLETVGYSLKKLVW